MSDPLIVIGLTGEAGAGKDAVATVLSTFGRFQAVALADALRDSLDSLDGRTWSYRKERDKAGMSERTALQLLGTECRERLGCEFLWCEVAITKILYASQHHPVPRVRFAIPDVRYPHEDIYLGDTIKELGGYYECWRVARPGLERVAESGHSSERHVNDIPCTRLIVNSGSLSLLAQRVCAALSDALRIAKRGAEDTVVALPPPVPAPPAGSQSRPVLVHANAPRPRGPYPGTPPRLRLIGAEPMLAFPCDPREHTHA